MELFQQEQTRDSHIIRVVVSLDYPHCLVFCRFGTLENDVWDELHVEKSLDEKSHMERSQPLLTKALQVHSSYSLLEQHWHAAFEV